MLSSTIDRSAIPVDVHDSGLTYTIPNSIMDIIRQIYVYYTGLGLGLLGFNDSATAMQGHIKAVK